MTATIVTADEAGFSREYAGIRLIEFEDGLYTHAAYGHHEPEQMGAAVHARETAFVHASAEHSGEDTRWWDELEVDEPPVVEHVWATAKPCVGVDQVDGWSYDWDGVTEETPGAFPMTVVPD